MPKGIEQQYRDIIADLEAGMADAIKFDKGNSSAGTRCRKVAIKAREACQAIRTSVVEIKKSRGQAR
jgi:hypothetical protein